MEPLIEKTVRLNALYDVYKALLTEKQRAYFSYYYRDDYSLSEIASLMDVSRNAVHEQVKNVVTRLNDYEETLRFVAKKQTIVRLLDDLGGIIGDNTEASHIIEHIKKVVE